MIITGVAEHAYDRIAHLVYIDALVPEHGQSAMDILPAIRQRPSFDPFAARARREGWAYDELPTGHDAQAEMPEALCELLLKIPPQEIGVAAPSKSLIPNDRNR
jgi:hypothetical protein